MVAIDHDDIESDIVMDDDDLLKTVSRSKLEELCLSLDLNAKGTKMELLNKLREYANAQADLETKRQKERVNRVENGSSNSKERYEIVNDCEDQEDEEEQEGFFYFSLPNTEAIVSQHKQEGKKKLKNPSFLTSTTVTAPPPPPMEPNENGERVVTIYSSKDQNDLTGIAAAQPGKPMSSDDLMTGGSLLGSTSNQPWDIQSANQKAEGTNKELEEATEAVTEVVRILLSMSGAPAFRYEVTEELFTQSEDDMSTMIPFQPPEEFVGFDPSKIPSGFLASSSQALRAGRGQVLQDVLRDFELHSIGQDGMSGDDVEKGGGHYHEVSKVRAFLEGFRHAELRRVARETVTILLDKLVSEGVDGLDLSLATMTRNSDDTSDAGELNDSLLTYLNDVIRQQEQRVENLLSRREVHPLELEDHDHDTLQGIWDVSTENGIRVESIDPNNPKVQNLLQDELTKSEQSSLSEVDNMITQIPETAPEKLLLLLTLLRERIKAEAAFGSDENGRHLRILAYCLRLRTEAERKQLIMKEMGNSLDRMDSFLELVSSSLDYAESTTHQLQPSKRMPLNKKLLKNILRLAQDIRDGQNWKASGYRP